MKAIEAGIDQFGGEKDTDVVVNLIQKNSLSIDRIDKSVRRILKNKFDLGLFDNPYVNIEEVKNTVNTDRNIALGRQAQKQSVVLLKNNSILPLEKELSIFIDGLNSKGIDHINVANKLEEADVVVVYLHTVFNGNQPSGIDRLVDNVLSSIFPNQDLDYSEEILQKLNFYASHKPLIVVADLNRPAVWKQ